MWSIKESILRIMVWLKSRRLRYLFAKSMDFVNIEQCISICWTQWTFHSFSQYGIICARLFPNMQIISFTLFPYTSYEYEDEKKNRVNWFRDLFLLLFYVFTCFVYVVFCCVCVFFFYSYFWICLWSNILVDWVFYFDQNHINHRQMFKIILIHWVCVCFFFCINRCYSFF